MSELKNKTPIKMPAWRQKARKIRQKNRFYKKKGLKNNIQTKKIFICI